jgi:hypothetical protein
MSLSRSILTCALALWLTVFTVAWCCCMGNAHTASMAQDVTAVTTAGMDQDHGCCASAGSTPAGDPASHSSNHKDDGQCDCGVKLLTAPSKPTVAPVVHAAASDLPVFHLVLITFHWLAPVPLSADHAPSPPVPIATLAGDSLLGLSCQLTI